MHQENNGRYIDETNELKNIHLAAMLPSISATNMLHWYHVAKKSGTNLIARKTPLHLPKNFSGVNEPTVLALDWYKTCVFVNILNNKRSHNISIPWVIVQSLWNCSWFLSMQQRRVLVQTAQSSPCSIIYPSRTGFLSPLPSCNETKVFKVSMDLLFDLDLKEQQTINNKLFLIFSFHTFSR